MADECLKYAITKRANSAKNTYQSQTDLQDIIRRLNGTAASSLAAAPASRQRQRGAGRGRAAYKSLISVPKDLSAGVLNTFELETGRDGKVVVVRVVKHQGILTRRPVVPIEELYETVQLHSQNGLGCAGINKLYSHVSMALCWQ